LSLQQHTLDSFELRLLTELRERVLAGRAREPRRGGRFSRVRPSGRGFAVAVAALCATAAAGGAVADTLGGGTISPQQWSAGKRVAPEQTVTPDQTADLGILRRPVTSSDALPSLFAQTFADAPIGGAQGVNVSLARRAVGFGDGSAAWVIPGTPARSASSRRMAQRCRRRPRSSRASRMFQARTVMSSAKQLPLSTLAGRSATGPVKVTKPGLSSPPASCPTASQR
jgi:hypothetical protein